METAIFYPCTSPLRSFASGCNKLPKLVHCLRSFQMESCLCVVICSAQILSGLLVTVLLSSDKNNNNLLQLAHTVHACSLMIRYITHYKYVILISNCGALHVANCSTQIFLSLLAAVLLSSGNTRTTYLNVIKHSQCVVMSICSMNSTLEQRRTWH
jgi:hypothetical protein